MATLWLDVKYAARVLTRSPGFAAVAVVTLALGIGANTAIFSLFDSVLLRSLPVRDPQRLAVFKWRALHDPNYDNYSNYGDCGPSGNGSGCSFSLPLYDRMRSQAKVFSGMAAFAGPMQFDLSGNGPASMADGELISGSFFSTLGVGTLLGRPLTPADDSPEAPAALVLSYGFWERAFGGDPSTIGRTIRLNTVPITIVGVADRRFTNLSPGKTQDFFLPVALAPQLKIRWLGGEETMKDPQSWWVVMVGRLAPGVSLGQAQAVASTIFRNEMLDGVKPLSKDSDHPSIVLVRAPEGLSGRRRQVSTVLFVLMCAVGFVLLIACANVAGLMLARSAARQKEVAVRLALGARRWAIAGQLLVESLTLSALGGVLGLLVAYGAVRAMLALLSEGTDRPFPFVVAPDWRIFAFALAASLLTGVLFGLVPALVGARVDLTPALRGSPASVSRAGARRFPLGGALVVAQLALSILVLSGAGMLVRSLRNLHELNPGFDTRNILLFGIEPALAGYQDAAIPNLYRDLQNRLAALPGVLSVSYSSVAMLSGSLWTTEIHPDGRPPKSNVLTDALDVGPAFFSTMRIPVLAGRTFSPADFAATAVTQAALKAARAASGTSAPAASKPPTIVTSLPIPILVNQAFAKKYLSGANPIGKHFGQYEGERAAGPNSAGYTIIGVVGDTKYENLRRDIQPTIYEPLVGGGAHFELRTAADPRLLVPAVRRLVAEVDANLPLFRVRTQSEQIDQLLLQQLLVAELSSFFGLLALALACIGLYGLLAFEVARRTREIGIRIALGAQARDVLGLVLRQGMLLTLVGCAAGLALGFALTRLLAGFLFGVRPGDPASSAAVVILLALVAFAACVIPARRALRVDPVRALRYE